MNIKNAGAVRSRIWFGIGIFLGGGLTWIAAIQYGEASRTRVVLTLFGLVVFVALALELMRKGATPADHPRRRRSDAELNGFEEIGIASEEDVARVRTSLVRSLLREALDFRRDDFEADGRISGAELVDWFGRWRHRVTLQLGTWVGLQRREGFVMNDDGRRCLTARFSDSGQRQCLLDREHSGRCDFGDRQS